ncbi:hypothetical protein [Hydrogenophaga sp.]|uniref:phage major capsid protein n=1 Tax=Hydrogenophaga sp. TaxID=1904254 RepID=UPI0027374F03|nr:hypothetical protein [Hydrogenophaga sp.]MDP3106956.1 hypothetical protein [Hydrogenophaga sp.]
MNDLLNAREILAASADGLAQRVGLTVRNAHPLSDKVSLSSLAGACGTIARGARAGDHQMQVLGAGLGTADFSRALAQTAQQIVTKVYTAQAQHTAACAVLEVKNFQPADMPGVDVELPLELLGELEQIKWGVASVVAGASSVRLLSYAKAVGLSRVLITNDQHGLFNRIFETMGAGAARTEAVLVAQALEANGNLDDAAPVFDVAYNNIEASALSGTALGSAMAKLRVQTMPSGMLADLEARHLIVGPDLEFSAKQLVLDAGIDVAVTTLANLPLGRWYLTASPEIQPTISILRLNGTVQPLRVEMAKRKTNFDGTAVRAVADLGAVMVSRIGVVKGGV